MVLRKHVNINVCVHFHLNDFGEVMKIRKLNEFQNGSQYKMKPNFLKIYHRMQQFPHCRHPVSIGFAFNFMDE